MTETEKLALVAKVTDKIGSEGKDVKSTFSTSSAGSPTDVLGGHIAELPIYRYQYVTLVGRFGSNTCDLGSVMWGQRSRGL